MVCLGFCRPRCKEEGLQLQILSRSHLEVGDISNILDISWVVARETYEVTIIMTIKYKFLCNYVTK